MPRPELNRREALALFGATLASAAYAQPAGFPSRPITIVVPYAAGGGTDVLARTLAEQLTVRLGQAVIIDNKPGATGNIGMALGVKAPPDGYALTFVASNLATNPHFYPSMPFQPTDFVPISLVARFASVLVTHPSSPFKNLRDVLDAARADPGKILYASAGSGSSGHLAAALLEQASGAKIVNVPYKGEAPSVTAALANEVPLGFSTPGAVLAHIASGRLRALGVTSQRRMSRLPEVPAIAEVVPGYESVGWFGIAGPKGLPHDLAAFYARAIAEVVKQPEVMRKLQDLNYELNVTSPENFQSFIASEAAKYGKLIKELNLKLA